jgi:inhibitor of growth protein 3
MADPTTVYSLALLAEYTHSLDSLPLDLSRNFADLRELDAVLSSSMSLITTKINQLTKMIEDRSVSTEDRLWLLTEIGDEAHRLKLGGEDKIRVASAAADNLRNHHNHLVDLLRYLPNFDPSVLNRATYYPHVTSKSYPPHSVETGRRQRRGGNLTGSRNNDNNSYFPNDPNPPKKKRGGGRDDDVDVGPNRTPRKERIVDMSNGRPRNNGRGGGGGRRYVKLTLSFYSKSTQGFHKCRVTDRISRVCRFTCTTEPILPTTTGRSPQRGVSPCKR